MKKILLTSILFFSLASAPSIAADSLDDSIKKLQESWTSAKYQSKDKSETIAKLEACAKEAEKVTENFPKKAEPIIWNGICLATQGEYLKISALPKVKEAKLLFEKALTIDEKALHGAAYTNLGVLYHRVPGWPIGFGDVKKSEENFKSAVAIAPENMDVNYFYGVFLLDQKRYDEAGKYLDLALKAPSRNRPLADSKRKEEIAAAIEKLNKKTGK